MRTNSLFWLPVLDKKVRHFAVHIGSLVHIEAQSACLPASWYLRLFRILRRSSRIMSRINTNNASNKSRFECEEVTFAGAEVVARTGAGSWTRFVVSGEIG